MALKDKKGKYYRITGMYFQYDQLEVKLAKSHDEKERNDEPEEANYFNVSGITLPKEMQDKIKEMVYPLLKAHKTNIQTIKHPAETGEDGEIIKEAYEETTFDQPYADFKDC